MRRLTVNAFKEVREPLEIHWLAGLEQAADGSWLLKVVTHALQSREVRMWRLSIGLFPWLSLGLRFDDGVFLDTQSRGEIHTAALPDLGLAEEVTSAEMPADLYTFFGRPHGVQKIAHYNTDIGDVFVPTMELVRYLLVHNKTLANAIMVPGQLMTLYHFEPPGIYEDLALRFTADMPVRALNKGFALEFAWLAIHPDGRRAWDSVYTKSAGKNYVSLDLPSVPDAKLVFRGIRQGDSWLVLEILHLAGRPPPCARLRYGHPRFKKERGSVLVAVGKGRGKGGKQRGEPDVEIQSPDDGTRVAAGQSTVSVGAKSREFMVEVPVEKIWCSRTRRRRIQDGSPSVTDPVTNNLGKQKFLLKGGVSREARGAGLPPLEFRTLEASPWDLAGELQALADTIVMMAGLVTDTEMSMSVCLLKPGRVFSSVGRRPRCCLVIHIRVVGQPPVVLIDVDRGGEWALSTMALLFLAPASFADIETHVKTTLDRLVDYGGRWDTSLDEDLRNICLCRRLPRVLSKRGVGESNQYRASRAWHLAGKLNLPLKGTLNRPGFRGGSNS